MLILTTQNKILPETRIVSKETYAVYMESKQIINEAQEKAKTILAKARQQFDNMFAEGKKCYEDEKQRGYKEGIEAGNEKQAELLFKMISNGVNYVGQLEGIIVQTCRQVLEKILGEAPTDERICQVVQNVLEGLQNTKTVKIYVHPEQTASLHKNLDDLLKSNPALKQVEIVVDNTLKSDQCLFETENGILDASIHMQIEAFLKSIEKIVS